MATFEGNDEKEKALRIGSAVSEDIAGKLEIVAKATGKNKSEFIREAVVEKIEREIERLRGSDELYEAVFEHYAEKAQYEIEEDSEGNISLEAILPSGQLDPGSEDILRWLEESKEKAKTPTNK